MAKKIRFLDKELLQTVNDFSRRVGYNRTLPQDVVAQCPDDKNYVVTPILVHEHKAGKACDPHMRCAIYAGDDVYQRCGYMLLDIDMGMYNLLPTFDYEPEPKPATDKPAPATVS